jgi:hypothetical protein
MWVSVLCEDSQVELCCYEGGKMANTSENGEQHDVLLILNQSELPEDFGEADLDELRNEVSSTDVRTGVEVEPGSDDREPVTFAVIFVIHFLSKHGMEIALGVAEGAFWDGVKATFRRFRRGGRRTSQPARVGVTYPDGKTVFVEAQTEDELVQVVQRLGLTGAGQG